MKNLLLILVLLLVSIPILKFDCDESVTLKKEQMNYIYNETLIEEIFIPNLEFQFEIVRVIGSDCLITLEYFRPDG